MSSGIRAVPASLWCSWLACWPTDPDGNWPSSRWTGTVLHLIKKFCLFVKFEKLRMLPARPTAHSKSYFISISKKKKKKNAPRSFFHRVLFSASFRNPAVKGKDLNWPGVARRRGICRDRCCQHTPELPDRSRSSALRLCQSREVFKTPQRTKGLVFIQIAGLAVSSVT